MLFHSSLTQEPSVGEAPVAVERTTNHQVVAAGIDSLILTFGGNAAPNKWLVEQAPIWDSIQQAYDHDTADTETIQFPDGTYWILKQYGRKPYKYVLYNDQVAHIRLWNVCKWASGALNKQQVYIDFRSSYIHSFSKNELIEQARKFASFFFEKIDNISMQITRVDLHADITHDRMLTYEECMSAISKGRTRQTHYAEEGINLTEEELNMLLTPPSYDKGGCIGITEELRNKFLLMYQNQSINNVSTTIQNKSSSLETIYYGKRESCIWAKLYDKSTQVKRKKDSLTPELWKQNNWNETDKVIRVEFSLRRDFLKELNEGIYVELENMISGISDIWSYLTNTWLRLVEEVKHNNTTTSKITDFWQSVVAAFNDVKEVVVRERKYAAKIKQLYNQGMGCLQQLIAIGSSSNEDLLYFSATIKRIQNDMIEAYDKREFFHRRRLLGLA